MADKRETRPTPLDLSAIPSCCLSHGAMCSHRPSLEAAPEPAWSCPPAGSCKGNDETTDDEGTFASFFVDDLRYCRCSCGAEAGPFADRADMIGAWVVHTMESSVHRAAAAGDDVATTPGETS